MASPGAATSAERSEMEKLVRGCGLSSATVVTDILRTLAIKEITLAQLSEMTMGRLKQLGMNQTMDQLKLLRAAKLSQAPKSHAVCRLREVKPRAHTDVVSGPSLGSSEASEQQQQQSSGSASWKPYNSVSYDSRSAAENMQLGRQRSPRYIVDDESDSDESSSSSSAEEETFEIVRKHTASSAFPGVSLSTKRNVPSVKDVFRLKSPRPEAPPPSSLSSSSSRITADITNSPTMRRLQKPKRLSMSELASPLTAEFSRELMLDETRAEHFRKFLESEHADENMAFYTSVEAYRSIDDDDDRTLKGVEILQLFIEEGSALEINLPHRLRLPIIQFWTEARPKKPAPKDLYEKAQKQVFDMLRQDSFSRFSRSVFYDMMIKGYQLRRITYNPAIFDTFVELCDSTDETMWDYALTKDGVQTWVLKNAPSESLIVKSKLRIRAKAEDILSVVTEPKMKLAFDENMVICDPVERFDANFKVVHMLFKSPSIAVKDRDCIVGMLTRAKPEGCVCISRSVPSVNHPPVKGVIRVDVESSGYLIIQDPKEPQVATVTYINQVNYKGRVPGRIAAKVAKSRMNTVLHLKEFMYQQEKQLLGFGPNRMSNG